MQGAHGLAHGTGRFVIFTLFGLALTTSAAKADVFVSALPVEAQTSQVNLNGFTVASQPQGALTIPSADRASLQRMAVLATILFFPGDSGSGGGSTSSGGGSNNGGGNNNGGGTSTSGSEAPEPASLVTALIGCGLLGAYARTRRRKTA